MPPAVIMTDVLASAVTCKRKAAKLENAITVDAEEEARTPPPVRRTPRHS